MARVKRTGQQARHSPLHFGGEDVQAQQGAHKTLHELHNKVLTLMTPVGVKGQRKRLGEDQGKS